MPKVMKRLKTKIWASESIYQIKIKNLTRNVGEAVFL